jgi:hypothetical protein
MASTQVDRETALAALNLIEKMIREQRKRVLCRAQQIRPELGEVDVRMLREFPEVSADPAWRYEDGQLAGLMAAKLILKARLLEEFHGGRA